VLVVVGTDVGTDDVTVVEGDVTLVVVDGGKVVEEGGCVEGGGNIRVTVVVGEGRVVVDVTGNVVLVVELVVSPFSAWIFNNVRSSSSFSDVCPRTIGSDGAVETVVHFSSTMIEG
jgi:hypothetical protein